MTLVVFWVYGLGFSDLASGSGGRFFWFSLWAWALGGSALQVFSNLSSANAYNVWSRADALCPRMLPVICKVSSNCLFGPSMIQIGVVILDFVSRYGFQPGWLSAEMSAGILASRFRYYFLKMLKANGILITTVSRCTHLHVFGLPNQSGFYDVLWFRLF